MAEIPERPKIYHITHLSNLRQIVEEGRIWSDAKRIERGLKCELVGMSEIKRRRLEELDVSCHPGTKVGQYVPFYFCPRSIMLYILHRGNHPDLAYRQGQEPIIHLQADLYDVVREADRHSRQWAFTTSNAGARYTNFFASLGELNRVNWGAVEQTDFRDSMVKDGKQAEFLVLGSFPWRLIEKIGVVNAKILAQVMAAFDNAEHRPPAGVEPTWYF